jgi:radical SAM-linked protein
MQSETSPGTPGGPSSPPGGVAGRSKYRLRFRKGGDLRLVSHHDLMHCFERMFRRASLPVPRTQGFNPRPRMWFALSLALGVVGCREVLELELTEDLPADEVRARLAAQAPPGIEILSASAINCRAGAHVRRAFYRLPLEQPPDDLAERCRAFLEQAHHWVERLRPQRRRLDVRPYLSELHPRADALEMALWVTPTGAARPEEVLDALGLAHVWQAGAVLERTDLELEDELSEGAQAARPVLEGTSEPLPSADRDRPAEAAAARPTALLPGPLSFDS